MTKLCNIIFRKHAMMLLVMVDLENKFVHLVVGFLY